MPRSPPAKKKKIDFVIVFRAGPISNEQPVLDLYDSIRVILWRKIFKYQHFNH